MVTKNLPSMTVFYKNDWFHLFDICIDLIASDMPGKKYRFSIIYYLLSIIYNIRYQISSQTTAILGVESVSIVYLSVNWIEREIWDIFGILVHFHPDLRRLLTDYGFQGFPLRKDFPVSGYEELFYSSFVNLSVYRLIELVQEIRIVKVKFSTISYKKKY